MSDAAIYPCCEHAHVDPSGLHWSACGERYVVPCGSCAAAASVGVDQPAEMVTLPAALLDELLAAVSEVYEHGYDWHVLSDAARAIIEFRRSQS